MDKQKYEREIEEILAKYDQETGRDRTKPKEDRQVGNIRPATPGRGSGPSLSLPNWRRISAGQYMGAALLLAMVAAFIIRTPPLSTILIIVAVALFIMPIVLYYTTGTSRGGWSSGEQKRWRGQVIDFNTRRDITDDPFEGIKRWFRRR
jgi:hypothetical protein